MGLGATTLAFRTHTPYEANLLRLAGLPYTLENGNVRNAYDIHLVNKESHRVTFTIDPLTGAPFAFVIPMARVTLEPLVGAHVPVFVTIPQGSLHGDARIRIRVRPEGEGQPRNIEAPFLGPSR